MGGNVFTSIGLVFDMGGALLLAMDVIGKENIEKLKNYLDRATEERIGFLYDQEKVKQRVKKIIIYEKFLDDPDTKERLLRIFKYIAYVWPKTSARFRRVVYWQAIKIYSMIIFKLITVTLIDIVFIAPYYWGDQLQEKTGVRAVPCLGILLLFVGFSLQLYGLLHIK